MMTRSFSLILPSLLLLSCSPTPIARTPPPPPLVPAVVTAKVGDPPVTTATGMDYQILKRGPGTVSPTPSDTVTVHYHGTLLNGTVFDSSVQRGQPATFPLNGVIAGWTEGLQLMKVGDKFKFTIPSNLAYGANSPSPAIPPYSTLVFEVELLAINGSTN